MTDQPDAPGARPCRRCGAILTPGASFCPECGASQRVVAAQRPTASPARQWWIPVAIGIGALAALGGGALLGIALMGDRDGTGSLPSGSPEASASASVPSTSGAPTDAGSPTPSASPTPAAAAVIPNRAIALVATDDLNMRATASDAATSLGALARGRELFVIGEPTEADEMRWYRVATLDDPGCTDACEQLIGFVATPVAEEDDAWIEETGVECPSSPMTDEEIGGLHPLERLHCYGRSEIVVEGTVDHPSGDYAGPYAWSPEWLAHPFTPAFLLNEGRGGIGFRPHPDADLEVPARGDVVRVTGHFEDPAATTCRASADPSFEGDPPAPLNAALVVLTCRASFVWTDYEVIE